MNSLALDPESLNVTNIENLNSIVDTSTVQIDINSTAQQFRIFTMHLNENMFTNGTNFTLSVNSSESYSQSVMTGNKYWKPVIQSYDDNNEYYCCVSKNRYENNKVYDPRFILPIFNSSGQIINYQVTDTNQGTELQILIKSDVEFTNSTLNNRRYILTKCRAISLEELNRSNVGVTTDGKLILVPSNITPDENFANILVNLNFIIIFFNLYQLNLLIYILRVRKNKNDYSNIDNINIKK